MLSKILVKVWNLLRGNIIWVILLAAILIVPFGYGATKVGPESTVQSNLDPNSQEYKDLIELGDNFSNQTIVVVVKGNDVKDIMSEKNMAAMKYVTDKAAAEKDLVLFALSPEYFVSLLKQYGQAPADASAENIVLDAEGKITPTFKNFFPTQQNALITLGMWKDIKTEDMSDFVDNMKDAIKDAGFDSNVTPVLTGFPIMMDYQAREMPKQLNQFMGVGVLLMLIALVIFFRVRGSFLRRWLVLGLVGVSILYTYGMMGFLDIPISIMSMVTLPILLGLGVDYAVQFHSRYDEESRKGKSANDSVVETLKHTGPPIIIAMLLCMAGLFSAVLVESPQTQYFGKALVMGVGICMVVALSLLLGLLYLMDKRQDNTRKPDPRGISALEKLMGWMLPRVQKFSVPIVLIAVILGGVGWYFERDIQTWTGFNVRNNVQEVKDMNYLIGLSGGVSPLDVVVKSDNVLKPEILQWAADKDNELMAKEGLALGEGHNIGSVVSIADTLKANFGALPTTTQQAEGFLGMMPKPTWINFVSEDHTALHISVTICKADNTSINQAVEAMKAIYVDAPEGTTVTVTGLSIVGVETARLLDDTRDAIELWGILFILIGLVIAFKFNIKRVIMAAVPVLLVLGWGAFYMKAADIKVSIVMALLPAQMIAIGIEFTILLLMRYYEERDKGEDPVMAMTTAMTKIGRAILVSGCMVILGFSVLMMARDFWQLTDFGVVTIVDMVLIIITTLVVLPALVLLIDTKIFKDRKTKKAIDPPITNELK